MDPGRLSGCLPARPGRGRPGGVQGQRQGLHLPYGFLSAVLRYNNTDGRSARSFLNFLVPELPAPEDPDFSKGILDEIDLASYRVEKQAMQKILLPDEDAEIGPVPTSAGGHTPEPERDQLSNILRHLQ